MKEVKNNLTMTETIAGILLTTAVEEYNKKKLDLPVIDNSKQYIKEEILNDCVKYSLIDSLGDCINNPDIILEFTDVFKEDNVPDISELNDTFIKLYVTLYLLSKYKCE